MGQPTKEQARAFDARLRAAAPGLYEAVLREKYHPSAHERCRAEVKMVEFDHIGDALGNASWPAIVIKAEALEWLLGAVEASQGLRNSRLPDGR